MTKPPHKVLFFANTDWYLFNFRRSLIEAARANGSEVVLLSPAGPYQAHLKQAGFRCLTVPMRRRSLNPISELMLLVRLFRIYSAERPDIAHHFTIKCVIYGGLAARAYRQCKSIAAVTGMGFVYASRSPLARALRPFVTCLLRLSMRGGGSRLIVQNPDDLNVAINTKLLPARQIRLIRGSGVDVDKFRPGPRQEGPRREVTAVFVGRLLISKGVREFVCAARRLRESNIDARFLIAGDPDPGNPDSIEHGELDHWRAEGVVTLLGHVPDMPRLFARCDVAVLPTRYGEGVPRSLIEAAAAGLALIATDVPGCREIVKHGLNGLLVTPGSQEQLNRAIEDLVTDVSGIRRMGRESRKLAVEEFAEDLVVRNTIAVYSD